MNHRANFAAATMLVGLLIASDNGALALTVEELNGASLDMTTGYAMRVKRAEGIFSTNMTVSWRLKVGSEGTIKGTITRTVTTPRGPRTSSRPMSGSIGVPKQVAIGSGHALWLLDGDKLTLLRTFEAGGIKAEITINGSTCSVRAPMVQEQGAGNTRRSNSVVGGAVEVLSSTPTSASCRISR